MSNADDEINKRDMESIQDHEEMKRELFLDNLLVRIHHIFVVIRWTGLAPWEFEFPCPGSLTSTFLKSGGLCLASGGEL